MRPHTRGYIVSIVIPVCEFFVVSSYKPKVQEDVMKMSQHLHVTTLWMLFMIFRNTKVALYLFIC